MPPASRASSLPPSLERIALAVRRHVLRARKALGGPKLDDENIHAARKELKRARSGLRLLRPLDETAYQRENMRLRNAARRLSPVRDHKVLLARLVELLAEERNPARRGLLLALRKDLYNARRRDWRMLRSKAELERLDDSLAVAARHVRDWRAPAQADGDPAAAPTLAVRKLYRKGRKALERSRKGPSDERLHEARKQAKHLAQALDLLAGDEAPKKTKKVLKQAEKIGDALGDDHDLAVVESRLRERPEAPDKARRKIESRLDQRRARLQKKALKAARKLYRKRTKRVLQHAAPAP